MAGSTSPTPPLSSRPLTVEWTLPNIITLARICLTPVVALLPFIQGYWPKVIAFVVFLIAAFSDLVDGYLARRYGTTSQLGILLDPIAGITTPRRLAKNRNTVINTSRPTSSSATQTGKLPHHLIA